ncbi:sialate O-acetylesterase [uncultured Polaribacter sp.]|uniref:sialate O-acetylesterase n=1 Tax=uncultured Polaribacter sp. TaxID=174711 RepID=UPI0026133476|nr:sialate O-acetylesterase [uncultured Polaribacter sp.]
MMLRKLIFIGLLLPVLIFGQQKKDTIKVFFLGGQSNMVGYGLNNQLPDSLQLTQTKVQIFNGNPSFDATKNKDIGIWAQLKPGFGDGFYSNGKTNLLSKKFGPELSFAKKLQELYTNEKIAIIKYARNGTSLDCLAARNFGCWHPDFKEINQFNHFLTTIQNALAIKDIDNDGKEDILIVSGIVWMQGESDAGITEAIASNYYKNLKSLMNSIRKSFKNNELPVVIGKISDSGRNAEGKIYPYGELVQYGQEKFVKSDKNAAIVRNTRFYKFSDLWHYNSTGFIDLGIQFAEALYKLDKK